MSKPIETRAEFQELAEIRLSEAKALLELERWDGAYYLAGYAVELALKACVIKMLMATDSFPDREFSRNCYTHDLVKLVGLAGLDPTWMNAIKTDKKLKKNWMFAAGWSEERRYHRIDRIEAESLLNAIVDSDHGVLPWIKSQW